MYTTVTALIDDIVSFYDNTESDSHQNRTKRRARILHHLNKVVEDLWFFRPWRFVTASASLVLANGVASLPADFANIGEGTVRDAQGNPWVEVSYQDMLVFRQQSINSTRHFYALSDVLTIPDPASTATLTMLYTKAAPVLSEAQASNWGGFPTNFRKALMLGTVAFVKEEEGEKGSWKMDYIEAKSMLARTAMSMRSRQQQLPSSGSGMW